MVTQAHQILERHLVSAPTAYTMLDLKRMTRGDVPVTLHTVRDKLEIVLQEKANGDYFLIKILKVHLDHQSM